MPVYNRAHCIKRALDSVVNQTQKVSEVIIIDDGSTDNLEEVIKSYSQPYIKLIRHEKNKGASAARNTGIKFATSEYIAFLDSDDVWHHNKTEKQMAFMQEKSLFISCTNFSIYREKSFEEERAYRPYKSIRLSRKDIAWGCFISPGSTLICKRVFLLDANGYDTSFPRFEDWDLLLRLSYNNDIGWLNETLADIYIERHSSESSELQGLQRMRSKFDTTSDHIVKRRIMASYWFHTAAIHFKHKRYIRAVFHVALSFGVQPFGHFPIKAILIPRLFNRKKIMT